MKTFLILAVVLIVGTFIYVGTNKNSTKSQPNHATGSKKIISSSAQISTAAAQLPKPPLSCSTSASLMPLTSDYSITGMNCTQGSSNNVVLICNGTIMKSGTAVTVDCNIPNDQTANQGVVCSGSAQSNSNGNLALSYNCYTSNKFINEYACTGSITNYQSLAINLPLSVNCGAL